ncbi:hypothetical protein B0O80DRAFT_498089 [Mortierella sp. GBAus27b]|nr:hypothetical protein B0O80DRAFT_498089 [Mortierella sp. GBAus27b]
MFLVHFPETWLFDPVLEQHDQAPPQDALFKKAIELSKSHPDFLGAGRHLRPIPKLGALLAKEVKAPSSVATVDNVENRATPTVGSTSTFTKKRTFGELNAPAKEPRVTKESGLCFLCHEPGHRGQDYPKQGQSQVLKKPRIGPQSATSTNTTKLRGEPVGGQLDNAPEVSRGLPFKGSDTVCGESSVPGRASDVPGKTTVMDDECIDGAVEQQSSSSPVKGSHGHSRRKRKDKGKNKAEGASSWSSLVVSFRALLVDVARERHGLVRRKMSQHLEKSEESGPSTALVQPMEGYSIPRPDSAHPSPGSRIAFATHFPKGMESLDNRRKEIRETAQEVQGALMQDYQSGLLLSPDAQTREFQSGVPADIPLR